MCRMHECRGGMDAQERPFAYFSLKKNRVLPELNQTVIGGHTSIDS